MTAFTAPIGHPVGRTARDLRRPIATLGLVGEHLVAATPEVDNPEISGLLGYLAALVDRVRVDLGYDARAAQRRSEPVDAAEVCALVAAELAGDSAAGSRLRAILAEQGYVEDGPDADAPGPTGHRAQVDPFTGPEVTGYLTRRLGRSDIEVEVIERDRSGYYMHTLFVTYRTGDTREEVVLRQIPPGLDATELVREHAVLERVWASQVPIPQPLWFEDDPGALGTPFLVSRRVRGRTLGTFAGPTEPVDPKVCEQLAELLAWLHRIDVSDFPEAPIPPMRTRAEIRRAVDGLEATAADAAGPVSPRLAAVLEWLRTNAPADSSRPSLIHGDVGFHNMLVAGDTITALLDWQRAHLGDPAEDLAYLRPSVESGFGWEHFLAAYVAAGGTAPDPQTQRFYTVWQDAWRTVECMPRAVLFDREPSLPTALAGFVMRPRFLSSALATAFPD